jgi:hypothetical protein
LELTAEPRNGALQSFVHRYLWLPAEDGSRSGNIGLAHLWIIFGAQILADNSCRVTGQFIDDLGKFFDSYANLVD